MGRVVSALTYLLAVAFSAEVLGYHARPFNVVLALIFLAFFLGRYVSREVVLPFRRRWPGLLLAFIGLAGVSHLSGWVGVLFISLLIGSIRLLQSGERPDDDQLGVCQTTALAYGVFLWFWRETAAGWHLLDGIANGVMWMTHHLRLNATLGPTALGLPVIILLLVYGVVCTLRTVEHRLKTLLVLFLSLLAVQIAFVAVNDFAAASFRMGLAMQRSQGMTLWRPFAFFSYLYPNNLQVIALLLGSAAAMIVTRPWLQMQGKGKSVVPHRRAVLAGAGLLLVGTMQFGFVPPRPAAHGEILICDTGYLNFNMPVFGSYGHKSGGMFGRLPGFLEACDYHVRRAPVSRESLKSANVLVVVNLMEKFDRPTKRAIWDFVRKGGSLLVIGDHTGLHNIREPTNDLLDPVNIKLNFDSAVPFHDGWLWGYSLPRHPATSGMDYASSEVQIWVGASLTISPPARPVVVGSYGFSDPGNPANTRDGNLGNLKYNPGEKSGDIPLAADCRYGEGRVLVFGDTSSLQNDALVFSHRFVENMFAWLAHPQTSVADPLRRCMAALFIVAGMILLAMRARVRSWSTIAAAAFLLGWALGYAPAKVFDAPSTACNDIAWIDASHLERFSINNMWFDDGLGGLTFNLMRNGYSPLLMRDWDTQALKRGSLLILIGPSKSFSSSEIKSIRQFVEGGGHLILASGWEDLSGSAELWQEFGLRVQQRPLGRVLVKQSGGDVRLYKGWPIEAMRGKPDVLCSPWGYPAIVRLRIGKGSVVAIADTQFLLNRNIEGRSFYYPANIDFLRRLCTQLKQNQSGMSRTDAHAKPVETDDGAKSRGTSQQSPVEGRGQ